MRSVLNSSNVRLAGESVSAEPLIVVFVMSEVSVRAAQRCWAFTDLLKGQTQFNLHKLLLALVTQATHTHTKTNYNGLKDTHN